MGGLRRANPTVLHNNWESQASASRCRQNRGNPDRRPRGEESKIVMRRNGTGRELVRGGRYEMLLVASSLVSIFAGVTLAVLSMPSDVAAEMALAVPGMWMCVGLAGVVGADVIARGVGECSERSTSSYSASCISC